MLHIHINLPFQLTSLPYSRRCLRITARITWWSIVCQEPHKIRTSCSTVSYWSDVQSCAVVEIADNLIGICYKSRQEAGLCQNSSMGFFPLQWNYWYPRICIGSGRQSTRKSSLSRRGGGRWGLTGLPEKRSKLKLRGHHSPGALQFPFSLSFNIVRCWPGMHLPSSESQTIRNLAILLQQKVHKTIYLTNKQVTVKTNTRQVKD